MFTEQSFEVFDIVGLEARMSKIREKIQPDFLEIGEKFLSVLRLDLRLQSLSENGQSSGKGARMTENLAENQFYLHIAKHLRRTTNAPESTWAAISTKPRGYKMEPHFQLGIWKDYVFVYLSIIDQPKAQKDYADRLLSNLTELEKLPSDFVISKDHTKAEFYDLSVLTETINRLSAVKKSEFEIGRVWSAEKFDGKHDENILTEMLETIRSLLPIYEQLMEK
ncbi:MAG: DUF1054 domain-containing protein [Streptococcaceae bacterium]|nr:DUF1054 domain-containing protein [Streptococcaceae bacterium]